MQIEITEPRAKQMARTLKDAVQKPSSLSYQQALEIVARQLGYAEFGALKAAIARAGETADGPPVTTLHRADLAGMDADRLMDLSRAVEAGRARLELPDLTRAEIEDVWMDCDILEGRLENPLDVIRDGFVGMRERDTASLLADIALNDQLYRLLPDDALALNRRIRDTRPGQPAGASWSVTLRAVPEGPWTFAEVARELIARVHPVALAIWRVEDGRVIGHELRDGALEAVPETMLPHDRQNTRFHAATAGGVDAFCAAAGLDHGYLWVSERLTLWSADHPTQVMGARGALSVLVPGADSPDQLEAKEATVAYLLNLSMID